MGWFTKTYDMPKGDPRGWSQRQVKHWLKHKKLDAFKARFAPIDGKALLAADMNEFNRITGGGPPAEPVLAALNSLRVSWHMAPLQVPVQASEQADTEGPEATAHLEEGEGIKDGFETLEITDRVTQESVVEVVSPTLGANAGLLMMASAPAQGVRDWAEALQPHLPPGSADTDSVVAFLEVLGKGAGSGLSEACAAYPDVADLFAAAFALHTTANSSVVNRENCHKAAGLAADVLRIVEAAWRRQHSAASQGGAAPAAGSAPGSHFIISDAALQGATSGLFELRQLSAPYATSGWLLHILCNKNIKESYDAAHNSVVDALKADGQTVLPGGRSLPRGDYRDAAKPVRRLVASHGAGSITEGIMFYKKHFNQIEGVRELVALLELGAADDNAAAAAVCEEVAAVPTEAGLDLDVYYTSLVAGLNGGGDAANDAVFSWYDKAGEGFIDQAGFRAVLSDLGLLEGKSEAEAAAYVSASFKAADKEGAGRLGRATFGAYYATLTTSKARQQLRARMGLSAEEELRSVFAAFASFGSRVEVPDMDNSKFSKLCKEAGLVGPSLTPADVDIIFSKSKAKGARKISFDQFLSALLLAAEKKGCGLEGLVRQVLATGGPAAHATMPENVRLHDDKSTYTGVYAKGGPKAVDPPKNDLSTLLDRCDADVRGVKLAPAPKPAALPVKNTSLSARKPPMSSPPPDFLRMSMGPGQLTPPPACPAPVPARRRTTGGGSSSGGAADLKEMFVAFATFGTPAAATATPSSANKVEMDGARFAKLVRECRLISKGFTSTRADLVFASIKQAGHNKIGYSEFRKALEVIASEKGCSSEDVINTICSSDGPLLNRNPSAGGARA